MLPKFVIDRYFIVEVCRKYHDWMIIFEGKKRRQFISLSFTVEEITLKNATYVAELTETLHYFKLSEVGAIKTFNKEGLFNTHLEGLFSYQGAPTTRRGF